MINIKDIQKELDKAKDITEQIENRAFHIGNTDIRKRAVRINNILKHINKLLKDK